MSTQEIKVPNIGDVSGVEVIEILVSPGDQVKKDDSLITLESDKASMEIPSPFAGTVESVQVKIGDRVSEGSVILKLITGEEDLTTAAKQAPEVQKPVAETVSATIAPAPEKKPIAAAQERPIAVVGAEVHAGPAVRRLAREFGVDLRQVLGTGN